MKTSVILIGLWLAGSSLAPAQTPVAYPARWEYKVVPLGSIEGTTLPYNAANSGADFTTPFANGLAKYGNDGWELVVIDTIQGNKIAVFKRPAAGVPK